MSVADGQFNHAQRDITFRKLTRKDAAAGSGSPGPGGGGGGGGGGVSIHEQIDGLKGKNQELEQVLAELEAARQQDLTHLELLHVLSRKL